MAQPVEVSIRTRKAKAESEEERTFESFNSITSLPDEAIGSSEVEIEQVRGVYRMKARKRKVDPARVGKAYSIRGASIMEPLATHNMFKPILDDEWEQWRRWEEDPEDPELGGWHPKTDGSNAMKIYYAKRLRGQTDWYRPAVTIRVTEQGKASVDLKGLGKIRDPGVGVSVPGGGNFLLIAIDGDDPGDGSDYTVSREYLSSGEEGWDPDFYKD
jgi:hypothetical protein